MKSGIMLRTCLISWCFIPCTYPGVLCVMVRVQVGVKFTTGIHTTQACYLKLYNGGLKGQIRKSYGKLEFSHEKYWIIDGKEVHLSTGESVIMLIYCIGYNGNQVIVSLCNNPLQLLCSKSQCCDSLCAILHRGVESLYYVVLRIWGN